MPLDRGRLLGSRLTGEAAWVPTVLRVVFGLALVGFSLSKFTRHADLVDSFERYGIPAPEAAVVMAGLIEAIGGLLLVVGLLVRPVGIVLALHFLVALVTAGPVDTDFQHVGLASIFAVLAAFLAWAGAGHASVDERLTRPPDAA